MESYGGWQVIKPLGAKTGQSQVFLARNPKRVAERQEAAIAIQKYTGGISLDQASPYATAMWTYARPEGVSDWGALKVFSTRESGSEAERQMLDRLRNEITVLKQNRAGLLPLLDSNEGEGWIVTEYQSHGTLADHPFRFRGNAALALRAFSSLVVTVAALHADGFVHRDIKPANVFFGTDSKLILGDFGIVFVPDQPARPTLTDERVGPRDYIPEWANLGERLENVQPNFDVYMLGKLLWCMVAGKLKLPREYHHRPEFDLTKMFRDDPNMYLINQILDKSVVEEPEKSFPTGDLLLMVNKLLQIIDRGGQLLNENVPRPCHICGNGFYQRKTHDGSLVIWVKDSQTSNLKVQPFVCDYCGHVEFFSPK
jgi:serine/threonine protein kinase